MRRSRETIVVDPGDDVAAIVARLARHQLTVKRILVTHAHIDHIAGAVALKELTGAPISYNEADLPLVALMDWQAQMFGLATPRTAPPDHSPADLEHITVTGIESVVLHTPGHSEGSIVLHVPAENLLLAGDTLFAGSIGRTDLPGGNTGKLLGSIRERLLPMHAATVVVPGHGAETTIGVEARTNPFLR